MVFKNSDYLHLNEGVKINFIAVPAIRRPQLDNYAEQLDYADEDERKLMANKIDLIFRYAVLEEIDSMGALGCGAFRNPPHAVRDLFQHALDRYAPYFKKIVFAVLSRDDNLNYQIFQTLSTQDHNP